MLNETNLDKVKREARVLLHIDMKVLQNGLFVQHPFFSSTVCAISENGKAVMLNLKDENDLTKAQKSIEKMIAEAEEYRNFLTMIRPPYLPAFFRLTNKYLCIKDYSVFLGAMWTYVEFPNTDPNISVREFVSLFRKADKKLLMEPDELKTLESLPERVTVYRGISGVGKVKGLSWTLSKEKAEWFANRWSEKGKVYQATIEKANVLAYFNCRSEEEIVLDCNKLIDSLEI